MKRVAVLVGALIAVTVGVSGVSPASAGSGAAKATDLLPSLSPTSVGLDDHDLAVQNRTGQVWLRFRGDIANTGSGPLIVTGRRDPVTPQTVDPANTLAAYQQILQSDGSYREVPVGQIVYHPEHHHYHFDGAAQYRLLDSGGRVVREAPKVAFCLADVAVVDESLPGYPIAPVYNSCEHAVYTDDVRMGISVGWADVYGKDLIGQSFDVTDLMNADPQWYSLEQTVNPEGLLSEVNQSKPASISVPVLIGRGVPTGSGQPRPGV